MPTNRLSLSTHCGFTISVRLLSLLADLSSGANTRTSESHIRKIAQGHQEQKVLVRTQGASFSTPVQRGLTCMTQDIITDAQQLACSRIMSCSTYLTSVERVTMALQTPIAPYGNGTCWCMYANDGDKLYLRHHTVSISKFSAHTELLSGIWVSGQPFLLS